MLGRHPHGSSLETASADDWRAVEAAIEATAIDPLADRLISDLSGGEKARVLLARALATEPKLLLLDEPASGLNPEETRDLAFWIDDIKNDLGITVIMVEHDMSLVSETADRVLCMNQGQALATGTAQEVQTHPDVVAAYLVT